MDGVLAALKQEFNLSPTTHINGGASGDCKTAVSYDSNIFLDPVTNITSVPSEVVSVASIGQLEVGVSIDQLEERVSIDQSEVGVLTEQSEEGVGKLSDESYKTTDELGSELSVRDVTALTLSDLFLTNNDATLKLIDSNLTNRETASELTDSNLSNHNTASDLINSNLSNPITASDLINSSLTNHMTTLVQNNPMNARGDQLSPEHSGKVDTTHPALVPGPTDITDMDTGGNAKDIQTAAMKIPAEQLVLEEFKEVVDSLIHSSPLLSTGPLTLPLSPPRFLKVTFNTEKLV